MNDKIGRYGILTCKLIDPFYILIDNIAISHNNKYNAVGFYYINENGDYNITLFDLYDSYHIKWSISHCVLSYFITSSYVSKIDFYAINENKTTNFPSVYTTNILKYEKNDIRDKLEERFIDIISGLLISYNYNRNYNNYLLNIINNKKHGDELINKVLLLVSNNFNTNHHFSEFIRNTLALKLKKTANYISVVDNNFDIIINNEIAKLKKCFFKIYTSHKMLLEVDLSIFLSKNIENKYETNNDILINKIDIKNLGYWVDQIISSDTKIEQILAVKNVITIYNNIIINYDIEKINIDKNLNIILNPELITETSSHADIILVIESNINTQNNTDLSILSYKQLYDILIYIDSLRDSSGIYDNKYSGIQNLITKELQNRTKDNNLK